MQQEPDERWEWALERREFVADSRDDAADERDAVADRRDTIADEREASADAREERQDLREHELDARALAMGMSEAPTPPAADQRETSRVARVSASEDREAARRRRDLAEDQRAAAAQDRVAAARPTLLGVAFAQIADRLYDAETYDEVLTRIAEAAVAAIAGGEAASVTLSEDGTYRTVGATGPEARAVDQEQYDADEGPCLDALDFPLVQVDAYPDQRWPVLGGSPIDHGVESSLSYRLGTGGSPDPTPAIGSLNVYATTPEAFAPSAVEIGMVLAAYASLAARAVGERAGLEAFSRQLEEALTSRDVIGQAKGILMERLKATPDEAFEILRRSSQRLSLKLREVAVRLTETGELADDDLGPDM